MEPEEDERNSDKGKMVEASTLERNVGSFVPGQWVLSHRNVSLNGIGMRIIPVHLIKETEYNNFARIEYLFSDSNAVIIIG